MRHARPLLPLLLALVAASPAQIGIGGPISQGIAWRTFKSGAFSNVKRQGLHVLSTEMEFRRYWQLSTGQPAVTAPPGVDWQKEKLVAVHLGERPTGGYSVIVRGVTKANANTVVVRAVERPPVPGSFVTEAITSPYVILRVDRTVPATFALSVETLDPRGFPGGGGGGNRCTCGCPHCCGAG